MLVVVILAVKQPEYMDTLLSVDLFYKYFWIYFYNS